MKKFIKENWGFLPTLVIQHTIPKTKNCLDLY